jgi:hypothetical protein
MNRLSRRSADGRCVSLTQSAPVGGVAACHNRAVVPLRPPHSLHDDEPLPAMSFLERLLTSHQDLTAFGWAACKRPLSPSALHALFEFPVAKFPAANSALPLAGVALALGLTSLEMAFAVGHISGAHFNPAVTADAWAAGRLNAADVLIGSSRCSAPSPPRR